MPKKTTSKKPSIFSEQKELFRKLFEVVLWPIIEPLLSTYEISDAGQLKEEIWDFFYKKLEQKSVSENHKKIQEMLPSDNKGKVVEFILGLVGDFTDTFYEEMFHVEDPTATYKTVQQLIEQQLILKWIEELVERAFSPLLFFAVKDQSKINNLLQIIKKIILVTIQDKIELQEALSQLTTFLDYNYRIKGELMVFIKAVVQNIIKFKEKYGVTELAKIAEIELKANKAINLTNRTSRMKLTSDTIENRERIIEEWKKNILEPSCIGIKIAGEEVYNKFIEKCISNFELFLDQTLSAEDFDQRLTNQLKALGGEEEELIEPIRDTISNSVRFLEIARIDDPTLSFLLLMIDDEKEISRKYYS